MSKKTRKKIGSIIIYDVVKYWVEPKKYGYEIRILDEAEDLTTIECHMKKKNIPNDEKR
jgi:hypothetical protein